jgi:hypothetical protein
MRDSMIYDQLETLFKVLICRWRDRYEELCIVEKYAWNSLLYANQIQRWVHVTCGLSGCIAYYDTTLNLFWERRNVFKDLGVYPDCMTILSLQHNPMLSYYRVGVQVRLIEANGGMGHVVEKKGQCLTAVGNPCSAHFV